MNKTIQVKAAWNIFGKSYLYRQKYNAYKAARNEREKTMDNVSIFDREFAPFYDTIEA